MPSHLLTQIKEKLQAKPDHCDQLPLSMNWMRTSHTTKFNTNNFKWQQTVEEKTEISQPKKKQSKILNILFVLFDSEKIFQFPEELIQFALLRWFTSKLFSLWMFCLCTTQHWFYALEFSCKIVWRFDATLIVFALLLFLLLWFLLLLLLLLLLSPTLFFKHSNANRIISVRCAQHKMMCVCVFFSNCFDLFFLHFSIFCVKKNFSLFFWNFCHSFGFHSSCKMCCRLQRINYKTTINCRKNVHAQILFEHWWAWINSKQINVCNFYALTPAVIKFIWVIQWNNSHNVI